jgi:hypothetical protein
MKSSSSRMVVVLPAPLGSQVAEYLARLDFEIELAQGLHRPKALGQTNGPDGGLAHRALPDTSTLRQLPTRLPGAPPPA